MRNQFAQGFYPIRIDPQVMGTRKSAGSAQKNRASGVLPCSGRREEDGGRTLPADPIYYQKPSRAKPAASFRVRAGERKVEETVVLLVPLQLNYINIPLLRLNTRTNEATPATTFPDFHQSSFERPDLTATSSPCEFDEQLVCHLFQPSFGSRWGSRWPLVNLDRKLEFPAVHGRNAIGQIAR